MAVVSLDDSDPIDAIALEYRNEMRSAEARGNFHGSVASEAIWNGSRRPAEDALTTKHRKKRVATAQRP